MNIIKNILIILFFVSCSAVQEPGTVREILDIKSEVNLFLSTQDPEVEKQVLNRLKQVQHETIKSILRSRTQKTPNPIGLQKNLKIKYNRKDYPYSLFIPSASRTEEKIPLVVVLHGLGGSGANTISAWVERLGEKVAVLCPTYPMGAWWARPAEEMVLRLIDETREKYNINSD